MRTTVNINDELLAQAKKLAQARNLSLGEVMSEGLRALLFPALDKGRRKPTRLVTFGGKGPAPGVDLDSNAALLDLMEGQ